MWHKIQFLLVCTILTTNKLGEVTNAENIKADRPKILRPTHFSCIKDIKAEKLVVGVIP